VGRVDPIERYVKFCVSFSLVSSAFTWSVAATAVTVLIASLFPLNRHRIELIAAVAVGSLVATVVALHFATRAGWIAPALPWNTQPWVWAALFALGWVGVGWRSGRRRSRVLAGAAVPVSIVMALVLFNAYFYYLPTFGDLVGHAPTDRASSAQVETATDWAQRFHRIGAAATTDPDAAAGQVAPTTGQAAALRALPHGLVLPAVFPSTRSHFPARPGWVYLPPAWWGPQRARLPVLELFGGTPSSPVEWLRGADVQGSADAFAAAHGGMAPVLAMVDDNGSFTGDTECVDRPGSLAETYAVTDVRNDLVRRFGVSANAHLWGAAGLSEGGLCALALGLRHSNDYSAIGDFGGEPTQSLGGPAKTSTQLFGGNAALQASYDPNVLMRDRPHPGLAAMFVSGNQDPNLATLQRQAGEARADGMRVAMRVVPGGHTYYVWREAMRAFISFAWQQLASPVASQPIGARNTDTSGDSTASQHHRSGLSASSWWTVHRPSTGAARSAGSVPLGTSSTGAHRRSPS